VHGQMNLAVGTLPFWTIWAVNLLSTEHGEGEYFIHLSALFQIHLAAGSPQVISVD